MRNFIALALLFICASSHAQDRAAMIQYFIELEEVETRATEIIDSMRDELIAKDKKLTIANFHQTYGTIFEDYRDAYIAANEKAYEIYSDQQIQDLYTHYTSDFGKWYRKEEKEFGPRIREIMEEPSETLGTAVQQSRKSKGRKKRAKKN